MRGEREPLYGIRYKVGDRQPFSLLAQAEVETEGTSPDSRIFQTITATISVGAFGRKTLFNAGRKHHSRALWLQSYGVLKSVVRGETPALEQVTTPDRGMTI
ncbi:hypothetical protein HFO56_02875 [Rhizobium laguerreae]|uniref:hypothetical protein n=1 Tax=Rhizobium laguerreae TaxID=1076926 RepID=UPI001C91EA09|nr:hypothetical protein [Rhizobium laguerreae]MBY3151330.1 hypothetical protein [Rhizobium laguerreae]